MDLSERGIEIRKKPGQIVHTCGKWMTMGVPTGVPTPVVDKTTDESHHRSGRQSQKNDSGLYDQSLHATKEPIKFALVKKFPRGMPWVPVKDDEERPNNGRLTFVMLLKGNQEPRMCQIVRELKDTNGLTKHLVRNAWMMEM